MNKEKIILKQHLENGIISFLKKKEDINKNYTYLFLKYNTRKIL